MRLVADPATLLRGGLLFKALAYRCGTVEYPEELTGLGCAPETLALAALAGSLAIVAVGAAQARAAFDDERAAGYDINPKRQSNWEPVVAVDPNHANRVYQLITGINAPACKGNCPGTSVLFRRSTDGGASFGPRDLRLRGHLQDDRVAVRPPDPVANDTNAG